MCGNQLTKKQATAFIARIAIVTLLHWHAVLAHADTTHWIAGNGDFTTPGNWNFGVPDSDDAAVFNRGFVAYEVNFPGGSIFDPPVVYTIDSLRVGTNEVGFVHFAGPFRSSPSVVVNRPGDSIIIGENAGDVAILNMALPSLSGSNAVIGSTAGATGTLNVGGMFNMSGDILVGAGALNVAGAGQIKSNQLNMFKGTLTIRDGGRATSTNAFVGATNGMATITGAGSTWTNSGVLAVAVTGTGALTIQSGGSVSNGRGQIGQNPGSIGTVVVTGPGSSWTNSGPLLVGQFGTGTLTVAAGASVSSVGGDIGKLILGSGMATVTGAGSTWNDGGLTVIGDKGDATLSIEAGAHVSGVSSRVAASAGSTWTVSGDLSIGTSGGGIGTLIASDGGIVSVGSLLSVDPGGSVAGNGMLAAAVVNRGEVRPGLDPGGLIGISPGTLDVDGSYVQSATGNLIVRLGGTSPASGYDQLQVSGAVTLNGTLSVLLANSFTPLAGNSFDILNWGSLSGTFSTLQLPALSGGLVWNTSQLYTTGTLRVVSSTLAADFNENGIVNAADLAIWNTGFGTPTGATRMQGDADNNAAVDGGDFLVWQRQNGLSLDAIDAAFAVPEPASGILAAAVCALFPRRRRQDSR